MRTDAWRIQRCACGAVLRFPPVQDEWPGLMLLHVRTEQHQRWAFRQEARCGATGRGPGPLSRRVYPLIEDPPPPGEPAYVCEDSHRTRFDGLHTESACRALIRHRQCCNKRARLEEAVPMA